MIWCRPAWNCPATRCCRVTSGSSPAASPRSTTPLRRGPAASQTAGISTAAAAPTGATALGTGIPAASRGWRPGRRGCSAAWLHSRSCGMPARSAPFPPGWPAEFLEPKVDWRRALGAEIRKAVADVSGAVDYTYRRPSRRATVTGDVVLPALRRPVPDVAVVCDTSGSMTDDLLAASLAEVEGLLRALGLARQLRVIACDAAASAARRVTSARQVELTGGGGTDMGAGIAAAAALRPRPAITVVLTDGLTPWPSAPPRGMKVVVGLLGEEPPEPPAWARAVRVPAGG